MNEPQLDVAFGADDPGQHPMTEAIAAIRGGLVVSCQAPEGHPLRDSSVMALLARCAELGQAAGVRVNSPADVRAVKGAVDLPVIGLTKVARPAGRPLITPGFELAERLVEAGADVVALEVTAELGALDGEAGELVRRVRADLGVPVMADVSTLEEGMLAWRWGAEVVSTTLSGYTPYTFTALSGDDPDLDLVTALASAGMRTVAEGRLRTAEHVAEAFARGAWAVVIGGAVTDPIAIARRLTEATPRGRSPR